LWPVDDELAIEVMVGYHRLLAAGTAPATALALTQRRMAKAESNAVWPGLIHVGG
jgi:CHAT domain-containing protein